MIMDGGVICMTRGLCHFFLVTHHVLECQFVTQGLHTGSDFDVQMMMRWGWYASTVMSETNDIDKSFQDMLFAIL